MYERDKNKGMKMRKPTKNEVQQYIEIALRISPQMTFNGLIRVTAKYFHCKQNEIKEILK